MSANSFGTQFCIHSFGESHGPSMGVVIDGCPSGVVFSQELLNWSLERRRPGQSKVTSSRKEKDEVRILSGVFGGKTLGTPIGMMVENQNTRPKDYDEIKKNHRRGHADDLWKEKFKHWDHRGGGRSSGRETICRVMAGAVAEMFVKTLFKDIKVFGYVEQIENITLPQNFYSQLFDKNQNQDLRQWVDTFLARFPDKERSLKVESLLLRAKDEGQSYGGKAKLIVQGAPRGLGQPVFRKLKSELIAALSGVGATCFFELGEGVEALTSRGTDFHSSHQDFRYGGIRGGISTGEDIVITVGFKPTSSVLSVAQKGRHDPCIVPRAIPVLEAMAWLVLADHVLWQRLDCV